MSSMLKHILVEEQHYLRYIRQLYGSSLFFIIGAFLRIATRPLYLLTKLRGKADLKAFQLMPDGSVILYPLLDEAVLYEMYEGPYERYARPEPYTLVVDVGAHIGLYSIKISKMQKRSLVIAIEPDPENFKILIFNLRLNRIKNVVALQKAITDSRQAAEISLYLTPIPRKRTTIPIGDTPFIKIPSATLDDILEGLTTGARGLLIKIDVEGAELACLKSAKQSLTSFKGVIEVVAATYHYNLESADVIAYMRSLGFSCQEYSYKGKFADEKLLYCLKNKNM